MPSTDQPHQPGPGQPSRPDLGQPYKAPKPEFKGSRSTEVPSEFTNRKPKRVIVAVLLAFFLGMFGAHNFYLGRLPQAIIQLAITLLSFLILFFIPWIWAFVEMFLILTAKPDSKWSKDGDGYPLVYG